MRLVEDQVEAYALCNVVCESTVHSHTTSVEVLAQEGLATTAVEAVAALKVAYTLDRGRSR